MNAKVKILNLYFIYNVYKSIRCIDIYKLTVFLKIDFFLYAAGSYQFKVRLGSVKKKRYGSETGWNQMPRYIESGSSYVWIF